MHFLKWAILIGLLTQRAIATDLVLSTSDEAKVNELLDLIVSESKQRTTGAYFGQLTEDFKQDVEVPHLHRMRKSRACLAKQTALKPEEVLVLALISHDKQFPGADVDFSLSNQGIPAITLTGATPAVLKNILSVVEKRKPPFKKIFLPIATHGVSAFQWDKYKDAIFPKRQLHLAIPDPAYVQPEAGLMVLPNKNNLPIRVDTSAKFADYLEAIHTAMPTIGKDLLIYIDACNSASGLEDWLRLKRQVLNRGESTKGVNYGIIMTALGNETETVPRISRGETLFRDLILGGSYLDRDQNGLISAAEYEEFASEFCKDDPANRTAGQSPVANAFVEFPIIKTGRELAVLTEESTPKTWESAAKLARTCKNFCANCKPHSKNEAPHGKEP